MIKFSQIFVVFCSVIGLLFSAGCQPKRSKGGGGVDGGGGGEFVYQSKEDVVKAVDEVWAQITVRNFDNPIGYAWNSLLQKSKISDLTREEARAFFILDRIFSNGPPSWKKENMIKDTEYIWKRPPHLEMDGLCSGPHDKKYLASVTKLDRSGEICISVHGLMRTPAGSLHHDLIGLFIHEAAHLNGFDEQDAQLIQKYILKNVLRILLLNGDEERHSYAQNFWKEKTRFWPILLPLTHRAPIDLAYVRRVASFANIYDRERIPEFLHRRAARPELRDSLDSHKSLLVDDIRAYAEDIYTELKAERTELLPRHLRQVRRLAMKLLEADRMLRLYLFHDSSSIPYQSRDAKDLTNEQHMIDIATGEALLVDPENQRSFLCRPSSEHPPTDLREEIERLGDTYRLFRCNDIDLSTSDDPPPPEGDENQLINPETSEPAPQPDATPKP